MCVILRTVQPDQLTSTFDDDEPSETNVHISLRIIQNKSFCQKTSMQWVEG